MAKKEYKVEVLEDLCKGCNLCVESCPKDLLSISDTINGKGYKVAEQKDYQKCNGCSICYDMCPDSAIKIYWREKSPQTDEVQEND